MVVQMWRIAATHGGRLRLAAGCDRMWGDELNLDVQSHEVWQVSINGPSV